MALKKGDGAKPSPKKVVEGKPGGEKSGIKDLLIQSRALISKDPTGSLEMVNKAVRLAQKGADRQLYLDAIITKISRLGSCGKIPERDRLIEEWSDRIEKEGSCYNRAAYANILSLIHFEHSEFAEALAKIRPCLENIESIGDERLAMSIKMNAGNAYSGLGIFDVAASWFIDVLRSAEEAGELQLVGQAHNNLGIVYRRLKDLDKAEAEFREVIEIAKKSDDKPLLSKAYNNLCGEFFFRGDWDQAMNYSLMAMEINQELGEQYGIQACLTNQGAIYHKRGELDKAMKCFEEALAIATVLGVKHQVATLHMNIGHVYQARKEYNKALKYFRKGLVIAEKISAKDLQDHIYEAVATIQYDRRRWKNAFDAIDKLLELRVDRFTGQQRKTVEELHIRYEVERKEREAALIRERNAELEAEVKRRIKIEAELKQAMAKIRVLTGLLPVCAECRKVRDDDGQWHQMEYYISNHSDAQFSHGYCPTCAEKALKQLKRDM